MINRLYVLKKKNIILLCLVLLVILTIIAIGFVSTKKYGLIYYKEVEKISSEYALDCNLVMAIIKTESSFDENAVSRANAIGFMQLVPPTAEWVAANNNIEYSEKLLFDYKYNIKLGCLYFKYLLTRFDENWAIIAYNAGETNVKRWIEAGIQQDEIPFKESREYLKRVQENRKLYDRIFK